MPDQGDGRDFVYHAKEASRWASANPLLDRHLWFQRQGSFPDCRWTGGDIDGLYTAHERWNSDFIIGDRHISASHLPRRDEMRLSTPRPAY